MPIQWSGTITSPQQLAGVIQGESATPAGQFAVASVMYNRVQNGGFGNGITGVVTPTQFNGYQTPGANAQSLANDLWNGNAPQGGSTGNALYFANPNGSTASWPSTLPGSGAVNIGGNWFSDQMGPPSGNFQAPQFNGSGMSAVGPADTSTGASPATSDPNYGDITGYPVAGVNAPAAAPGSTPPGVGAPTDIGLQPSTTQDIGTWVGQVTKAAGQGVQSAISAAESGLGTYFGSAQNWFTRAVLILVGLVILAIALIALMWDHGGKQVATQAVRVAAI